MRDLKCVFTSLNLCFFFVFNKNICKEKRFLSRSDKVYNKCAINTETKQKISTFCV